MVQLLKIFVLLSSIAQVKPDLIGFNRLGNNVHSLHRFREGINEDYKFTNYQSMMKNTVLTMGQKKELLNFLAQETPAQNRGIRRNQQPSGNHAQRQFLIRRKVKTATGRRVARLSNRLNAYKRRMNHKLQ